ncbi:alpha-actinin, sarcomeric [Apis florea]|uniref:alpha-actinin, sarcomeric n=1 Tax=Apis florea TaxID=7463 RepID=UPI000252B628|nr:alpha-actinin, sarcomeric [Apis florea]XP_012341336.1 alpha-actinin, sarcomeric [Apis florea]XP_012341337.1 alpha-actinin, sarcomeric [Apis florea]
MNDMEAYGDGYMEPEEEWEREGLLDPAWEKQQKKRLKALKSDSITYDAKPQPFGLYFQTL